MAKINKTNKPKDDFVDPLYSRNSGNPPISPTSWKPTIPEPELRPGGRFNPVKSQKPLDPMFNRKTK